MESKAKLFGHAIHPILIVYPLGLLSTAVIFDIIYLVTANPRWATVSFWIIAAGLVGGLLAAMFGLIDYLNIPSGTRAKRIGMLHGLINLGVVLLFAASWWLRFDLPEAPPAVALVLSFIGVGAASLGGWLGGELVERLGVGVAENANLNAPNSLTQPDRNETHVDRKTVRHA
ncbi:MAG TPA: DUF2231 domain-containing protein [Pyrinomonadaceae bacterium]|nr:DUF2231 domain-containing protein [Pyrinomonadaceae bacterium]